MVSDNETIKNINKKKMKSNYFQKFKSLTE